MEKILLQDENYAGLYVALKSAEDSTVVGSAKDPEDALREAESNGYQSPILFYVPKRNSIFHSLKLLHMPKFSYPFVAPLPGEMPRPYTPVRISNPATGKYIETYALIDTGADECAHPSIFAKILGHNLVAGEEIDVDTVKRHDKSL